MVGEQIQACKGCGNAGKHLLSKDGFCTCAKGREMKELHEARVERYFERLTSKGGVLH